ncbi:MAG: transglutaminase domain-containing protein [Pseudomonadota bacterium]
MAPGRHIDAMPPPGTSVRALCDMVGGLFVHADFSHFYGLRECEIPADARVTWPMAERLDRILDRCDLPLHVPRPVVEREFGTCRDYALMLCGLLRATGQTARVRCGFARYFSPEKWEDHWVCEVADEGTWRRADAQLDAQHRNELGITFDPDRLPNNQFVTAPEAWTLVRSDCADASDFGHGEARGAWFMHVNLMRDHLAEADVLASDWDRWREAPAFPRPPAYFSKANDRLCQAPPSPVPPPFWLARAPRVD